MTTIVLGESGQLAQHLRRILSDATFWGRASADASDAKRLEAALLDARPTAIVNAAAFTAVDLAETEYELAWRLNAEAPAAAARAAAALDIPLVHVSTDYVFDGRRDIPYTEHDPVNPLNVYGRTKLAGELAIKTLCVKHWILRTSWVFSEYGKNFVTTMLRLASRQDSFDVVADQFGRPTHAGDLAAAVRALVAEDARSSPPPGTYHAVGGPVTSWHGFAELIFREAQHAGLIAKAPVVRPITTAEYRTVATRPLKAVLKASPVITALIESEFDYRAGVHATLLELSKH